MHKLLNYLPLVLFLGTSSVMVSCKKDDIENVVLKQTGNVKATFLNGDQPIKNSNVRLSSENGALVEFLTTDEAGVINLTNYLEGNYIFSLEINEPHYVEMYQEFQVLSGLSKEQSIQLKDHVGNLSLTLADQRSAVVIKEDLKIGVALVPNSIEFKKALTHKQILALAKEIKYFGNTGTINFNNVPTGNYHMYKVGAEADTILSTFTSGYQVNKYNSQSRTFTVSYLKEVVAARSSFTLNNIKGITSEREQIETSPFSKGRIYKDEEEQLKLELTMENDVYFTLNLNLNSDDSYSVSSRESSDPNYYLDWVRVYNDKLYMSEGKLNIKVDQLHIYDYTSGTTVTRYYDLSIIMD